MSTPASDPSRPRTAWTSTGRWLAILSAIPLLVVLAWYVRWLIILLSWDPSGVWFLLSPAMLCFLPVSLCLVGLWLGVWLLTRRMPSRAGGRHREGSSPVDCSFPRPP